LPPTSEKPLRRPIVCYVTDRNSLGSNNAIPDVSACIRAAMDVGADWIQLREKDLSARDLLALAREAVEHSKAQPLDARVIVNDRLDVAVAAAAGGVHLGSNSLPPQDVVGWCRGGNVTEKFLVGVSCHHLNEARDAESAGASYIFFGPVFDTPSKRAFGQPQGTVRLAEVCRMVPIPVIAIGGVDEGNAAECLGAGAAGIAGIRMFQEPEKKIELARMVARLRRPY
jgi:thiamine-phosphate pyrophosphorylase